MANLYAIDYHIHTRYSSDSTEEPEAVIKHALAKGLDEICFTDHMDLDYPSSPDYQDPAFVFDAVTYYKELSALRQKYTNQNLHIRIGMELGLMPYLASRNQALLKNASDNGVELDYIIGSTHLLHGLDPYYEDYWKNRRPDDVVDDYFTETLLNIKTFSDFSVYGHLDYITRYVPDKNYQFDYHIHDTKIDAILTSLISKGIGIEVNYSNINKGLTNPNPSKPIIKRYKHLGGEIITMGSDAHSADNVGRQSAVITELIKECGFDYISVFDKRKNTMVKI